VHLLDVGGAAVVGDSKVADRARALRRQRSGALQCIRSRHIRISDGKQILGIAREEQREQPESSQARRREPPIAQ